MNRAWTLPLLAAAVAFAPPSHAITGVPSPANSTVPPCILAVPAGPPIVDVVVRDISNLPIQGSLVVLDLSSCADLVLCPDLPPPGSPHLAPAPVSTTTDASGVAHFSLRGGGSCLPGAPVFADGVLLGTVRIVSPDQDGNGAVDGADQALLLSRIAVNDPRADLDCNGSAGGSDVALFTAYLGAVCAGPTSTRSRSWGRVKQIYR